MHVSETTVRLQLAKSKMVISDLMRQTGVARETIKSILDGNYEKVKVSSLRKIEDALPNTRLVVRFEDTAGILPAGRLIDHHRFLPEKDYVENFTNRGEAVPPFLAFLPYMTREGIAGYMVPCPSDHPDAEEVSNEPDPE